MIASGNIVPNNYPPVTYFVSTSLILVFLRIFEFSSLRYFMKKLLKCKLEKELKIRDKGLKTGIWNSELTGETEGYYFGIQIRNPLSIE